MSSLAAPRCRHIKVNGTQCGSPALRNKNFCFYHQENRPMSVGCYYPDCDVALGEISLPVFEDAHSIQTVIRQIVQMVLQKRLDRKTAGLVLYALQTATSNLKRMELEKPQSAEIVTDLEHEAETKIPIATATEDKAADGDKVEPARETSPADIIRGEDYLPIGTIQACHQQLRRKVRDDAHLGGELTRPERKSRYDPQNSSRRTAGM